MRAVASASGGGSPRTESFACRRATRVQEKASLNGGALLSADGCPARLWPLCTLYRCLSSPLLPPIVVPLDSAAGPLSPGRARGRKPVRQRLPHRSAEEGRTLTGGEGRRSTVVCVGYARLPQSLSPLGASIILVEMEVDVVEERVVGITLGGFPTKASDLLSDILVGRRLRDDLNGTLQEFQRRYVGAPQKAICTAVMNAYESYERYLRQSSREFYSRPRGYEGENH